MEPNSFMRIDWEGLQTEWKESYPGLPVEPRQFIISVLSYSMNEELEPLIDRITNSIMNVAIKFPEESPDNFLNHPLVKMEMAHIFPEYNDIKGGNPISLLPEPKVIESFFTGYRIDHDLVITIGAVNAKIKQLNTLKGYSYGEFYTSARQILSLLDSLKDNPEHINGNGFSG